MLSGIGNVFIFLLYYWRNIMSTLKYNILSLCVCWNMRFQTLLQHNLLTLKSPIYELLSKYKGKFVHTIYVIHTYRQIMIQIHGYNLSPKNDLQEKVFKRRMSAMSNPNFIHTALHVSIDINHLINMTQSPVYLTTHSSKLGTI